MAPIRFYIILLGFFLAALLVGFLYFLTGMGEASYLVTDGVGYGLHFIDKPRYDLHIQGIIFTLTFLAAAILMLILIVLPDQRALEIKALGSEPPQPRRRPVQAAAQPAAQPAPHVPVQVAAPRGAPTAAPAMQGQMMEAAQGIMDQSRTVASFDSAGAVADSLPSPVTQAPSERSAPIESIEDQLSTIGDEDRLDDVPDGRYDDQGEEDVVYGNGRVSDDSVWEFIHNYPDSAVKFLYRKTLENKPLTPTEEDIYRKWEMRGMSRTKVRKFLLEIMGWKSLPDDFPHNIWKSLRDQIFEIKSRRQA